MYCISPGNKYFRIICLSLKRAHLVLETRKWQNKWLNNLTLTVFNYLLTKIFFHVSWVNYRNMLVFTRVSYDNIQMYMAIKVNAFPPNCKLKVLKMHHFLFLYYSAPLKAKATFFISSDRGYPTVHFEYKRVSEGHLFD